VKLGGARLGTLTENTAVKGVRVSACAVEIARFPAPTTALQWVSWNYVARQGSDAQHQPPSVALRWKLDTLRHLFGRNRMLFSRHHCTAVDEPSVR
jgi:hypothetical protein